MQAISIETLCFRGRVDRNDFLRYPIWKAPKSKKFFLKGPSGSGKSTLLNLITGLLEPNEGEIYVLQTHPAGLSLAQKDQFRVDHTGFKISAARRKLFSVGHPPLCANTSEAWPETLRVERSLISCS